MRVKALVSFAGAVSMHLGEIRDIADCDVLNDLLRCGYVASIEQPKEAQDEVKRVRRTKRS